MRRPVRVLVRFAVALALALAAGAVIPSAPAPLVAQEAASTAAPAEAAAQPAGPTGLPSRQAPPRTLRDYTHVFVAFAIAWLLLFGYALSLGRKFARIEREMDALRGGRGAA